MANEVQALYLELIRRTNFNSFDGRRVALDLADHPDLWLSVVMWSSHSLIVLRDLPRGGNNVDTLYLIPAPGKEFQLEELAQAWEADTVQLWGEEASLRMLGTSEKLRVLECWWD